MSSTVINTLSDITLPEWLENCLKELSQDAEAEDRKRGDAALIGQAFEFAYQLHQGQYRKSGEPYICHPVAVAGILRELGGSAAMIAAGFLHDVVEDTDITIEEIEQRFGTEVRRLVEGVTKLSKINFQSKTESQAENFRRMFLAMAQDIRVIVVKLADRLHNMRTLEHLRDEKRRRIALETREIFAPLANRLGIWRFKWELEDLAFKYLEAEAYRQIQQDVTEKRGVREQRLTQVVEMLQTRLVQAGIECIDISGRPKHLYSVYQKMQVQNKEFDKIDDLVGLRIIVKTNAECYRALAVVHNMFRPIPGCFKDYIGLPKPNLYQSLHTIVVNSTGQRLEVQIRTLEMDYLAEYGIAAYWIAQSKDSSWLEIKHNKQELNEFAWLNELVACDEEIRDASEYIQSIKNDLKMEEIYVFTPKGDLISLPTKSTPVDFAYKIHTKVGNRLAKVKINGEYANEITILTTGDTVEIITDINAEPKLGWVNAVATNKAKNAIRKWHRHKYSSEFKSKLLKEYIEPFVNFSFISVDRVGILKDILEKFFRYQINVQAANVETDNGTAKINLSIEFSDVSNLNNCIREICQISDILECTVD